MQSEVAATEFNTRKNAQWNQRMTEFLLKYLAEAARNNLKGDRGFKSTIIHSACKELNKEFNISYVDAHITNHIKSLKKNWRTIQTLMGKSGVHFDDATKIIVMGEDEARTLIEQNPATEKWLNKPIMWYDEMVLACGNDMANGNRSKSGRSKIGVPYHRSTSPVMEVSPDGGLDDAVNLDVEDEPRAPRPNSTSPGSKKRKRIDDLANHVGDLVKAIGKPKVPVSHQISITLWEQLKTLVDVFPIPELRCVHHHFLLNETVGSMFIAYNREEKTEMIDELLLDPTVGGGRFSRL
ncbi:hypothetical protein LUZ60_000773 [Juncus effusus]|nr:hypothetical protein LUZ60_005046 [Juncus effusus]KAJ3695396.1 hypothetical protein LUZ60_000773 [Juncus effusus]